MYRKTLRRTTPRAFVFAFDCLPTVDDTTKCSYLSLWHLSTGGTWWEFCGSSLSFQPHVNCLALRDVAGRNELMEFESCSLQVKSFYVSRSVVSHRCRREMYSRIEAMLNWEFSSDSESFVGLISISLTLKKISSFTWWVNHKLCSDRYMNILRLISQLLMLWRWTLKAFET